MYFLDFSYSRVSVTAMYMSPTSVTKPLQQPPRHKLHPNSVSDPSLTACSQITAVRVERESELQATVAKLEAAVAAGSSSTQVRVIHSDFWGCTVTHQCTHLSDVLSQRAVQRWRLRKAVSDNGRLRCRLTKQV